MLAIRAHLWFTFFWTNMRWIRVSKVVSVWKETGVIRCVLKWVERQKLHFV